MTLIFKKSTAQPNFEVGAAIIGTAQVGQSLECTYTVTKAKPQNVTVQWYSYNYIDEADPVAAGETLLGTGATYALTSDELNKVVRAKVTATNPAGTVTSSAYTTNVLDPQPAPVVVTQTAIVGTLVVGSTLSLTWDFSGESSVEYSWYRATDPGVDDELIGTGSTYTLTANETGEFIKAIVYGTNAYGTTPNPSEYSVAVTGGTGSFLVDPSLSLDPYADGWAAGETVLCECQVSGGTPSFAWYWTTDAADDPGNRTYISANTVATMKPLPVSEPNRYRSAYFADTATFDGASVDTRYIGCAVTAGETTVAVKSASPLSGIQGTPISQTTIGAAPAAPYFLNPNKLDNVTQRYYLTEDVEFAGSGFVFQRNNIKLNLNGYKISYNTSHPTQLTNPSWESGTTGWDFTNAPHASVYSSVDSVADYRLSRVAWGKTAAVKFNAEYTGEYVQSTSTVTLLANVRYAAAALCSYGAYEESQLAVTGFISLVDADTNEVVATGTAGKQGTYWNQRGAAHLSVTYTPSTTKQYYVRIGVSTGQPGATLGFYVSRVLVARTQVSGCLWYPVWAAAAVPHGDVTIATNGAQWSISLRNGTIEEVNPSIGRWPYRYATILAHGTIRGCGLVRLNIITRGDNCNCVFYGDSPTPEYSNNIYSCTFTNYNVYNQVRDNYYGGVTGGVVGTIAYNTITKGIFGFSVATGVKQVLFGNTIELQEKYSNAFAIFLGKGSVAYDNIINCGSGENSARGIAVTTGTSASVLTKCYNNIINVQMLGHIQEYKGGWVFGNYGIQCEAVEYGTLSHIRVYDNVVTANGNTYRPSQALRTTVRPWSPYNETVSNVIIENNTFNAYTDGTDYRSACLASASTSGILYNNNTMRTNSAIYATTDRTSNVLMNGTHIVADSLVASPLPWNVWGDGAYLVGTRIEFTNTTFEDAASQTLFNTPENPILTVVRTS